MQLVDHTGQRFERLTVIERAENTESGRTRWLCKCDCGNKVVVTSEALRLGRAISCGCYKRKRVSSQVTHGMSRTPLYAVWKTMKARCYRPRTNSYERYGGRGITVCDEWLHDFQSFYDWAMANGYDPDAPFGECTLDRINVDGNYCPENCRWATSKQQVRNRRNTLVIEINGEKKSLGEWCEQQKISYKLVHRRIYKYGHTPEEALEFSTAK